MHTLWQQISAMDFPNQHHFNMETLFDLDPECPLACSSNATEAQSSGFNVYNPSISSTEYSGTQGRRMLPIEREMENKGYKKCKRLKSVPTTQPCGPENPSPLGLTLRKSPSFLDLVESKLSPSDASFSMLRKIKRTNEEAAVAQNSGKTKASNISACILRIGSWERLSRYDGELVAKCYFAKRKLVWEVLDGSLKRKIEVQWSDVASLKATYVNSASETLEVELLKRPLFFHETNPQPRKHTLWKATSDFTDGEASIFRRHFLQFPQGTLQKHFEKLLQLDDRLYLLSKKPYPSLDSAFFTPDNIESQNLADHRLFGSEGQLSDSSLFLNRGFSISATNMFPSASILDFDPPDLNEGCYNMETSKEVSTYLNPNSGKDSSFDYEPNYWISDIQTNQKLADPFDDTDGYLSRLCDAGELRENTEEFPANMSGIVPFPVFVVEDDVATSSRDEEVVGWTSWA